MTVPYPFPRKPRLTGLAAAALLALATQPARADLFQDEFVTPKDLVTLPAGIAQQCDNIIVSRAGNDTVLDIPDILPITVEVWGINMERLQTVAPSSGAQRATKGLIRTAFTNRDGAGANGRGCRLKDSAEVTFQSDLLTSGPVTQNFTFTKNLEAGSENFFLPVKFHPIIPTLVTQNVQSLTGANCLGAAGATVTPDGITIEIKNLSSLFSALTGCLKLDLQAGLPTPLPELDVPSADLLLGALDLQLVPRLASDASLFSIARDPVNPALFNLDVLNVQNLVNSVLGSTLKGGTTPARNILFDLKSKGVARRPFTVQVKVVPPPVLADLVPVVNGDLLDIVSEVTTGLLGQLTQKVGVTTAATCTANNVPVKTGGALAALLAAILTGDPQAVLTALTAAATDVTLPPIVFGARNNGPGAVPSGTQFTTTFAGTGGGPLNSSLLSSQGLAPQTETTQQARGPKALKLLNLDLTGVAGVDPLGILKGCLVMPGFIRDPDSAQIKADSLAGFRNPNGQVEEANESNNSTTLD